MDKQKRSEDILKINHEALLFVCETIQNTISRLSKINYSLIIFSISLLSIFTGLQLSVNVSKILRLVSSISLFIITTILFVASIYNLRNEKVFRIIYKQKISMKLSSQKIETSKLLSISPEFIKAKKEIKLTKHLSSFITYIWLGIFIFSLVLICYSIFVYYS